MKYPRIPHLLFSNPFDDDFFMENEYKGRRWIVTEKIDGSQISIEFDEKIIRIYNRNTSLLMGKMDRQFHILPQWLNEKMGSLWDLLDIRYILLGDWMFHQHTIRYTRLPDWLITYGLFDKEENVILDYYTTKNRLESAGFSFIPTLYDGIINSKEQILSFIKKSNFSDDEMEGLVLHSSDGKERCKYVTERFKALVDNNRH